MNNKINFFALGGLDQKDSACYILEIENDIFVINTGISVPITPSLGVNKIVPDYDWLINNKSRIKGIFIGYPEFKSFGGLEYLYPYIYGVPIYTNQIGAEIINHFNDELNSKYNKQTKLNLKILNPNTSIRFNQVIVTSFNTTSSIPMSNGFIFTYQNRNIVYIDNFVVSSNTNELFKNDFLLLNKKINNENSILITGVGNAGKNKGFTVPNNQVYNYFLDVISNAPGRTIIACNANSINKAFAVIQAAISAKKPIVIFSNFFGLIIKHFFKNNLIDRSNLMTINHDEVNNSKDAIILIISDYHQMLGRIRLIISNEDKYITFNNKDTFVYADQTAPGYEKNEARLFDELHHTEILDIKKIPKTILDTFASNEDHRFLVNLLKPKYIIPVSGLYMSQVEYQKTISGIGFDPKNILLLENGQKIEFENNELTSNKEFIKLVPKMVGTYGNHETNPTEVLERDTMKENGCVIVGLYFDQNDQLKKYNFDNVGVFSINDEVKNTSAQLNEEIVKVIQEYVKKEKEQKTFNKKEFKNFIKKLIIKNYRKKFDKEPMAIITVIGLNNF